MQIRALLLFVFLACCINLNATVFDRIVGQKVGVSLGKISLHRDTALHTQTNTVLNDGELLDIIGESRTLHFDKDENQKFKWYRVRTAKKQEGWVFGDALAIATPHLQLDSLTAPFSQQKMTFSTGFEEAIVWFASVEGIEIKGNQYLNNPLYLENYLVLTNPYGKSVSLYLSGRGVEGEQTLKSLVFQDLNEDKIKEIILEKSAFNEGSFMDNRSVEAYAFTTVGLNKIFEESLSLKEDDNLPTPALYKVIEFDNQLIRVSFVDFVACEKYKQSSSPNAISKTLERCLEYVTYTYGWDIPTAQFKPLYAESRLPLMGFSKSNYFLYESPTENSKKVARLLPDAALTLIQTYNDFQQIGDETQLNIWLFVEDKFGKKGYLPAYQVYLGDAEHATVLHDYFNNPPAYLGDWKSEEQFLFVGQGIKKNEEE